MVDMVAIHMAVFHVQQELLSIYAWVSKEKHQDMEPVLMKQLLDIMAVAVDSTVVVEQPILQLRREEF